MYINIYIFYKSNLRQKEEGDTVIAVKLRVSVDIDRG